MKLIITDNETKIEYLKALKNFNSDKYISKKEFFEGLLFSYDYKSIIYLMKNYQMNIDNCYDVLKSLYAIDIEKEYKTPKLKYLKQIKKELIENELLYFNPNFKEYLKRFNKIEINNISLEKYEQEILNKINISINLVTSPIKSQTIPIYEYKTKEDEISGICISIRKLLDQGIDINNIVLTNIFNDDYYLLEKIFNEFDIPISLDKKLSIYNTKMIKDYLQDKDINKVTDPSILKKLIKVLNELEEIDKATEEYDKLLVYLLKETYIDSNEYKNSIRIKSINSYFLDDYYVFALSFNNNIIPKYFKDDEYLLDIEKQELPLYCSYEKNELLKQEIINKLKTINNLSLSYHLYDKEEMYISDIEKDLDLKYEKVEDNYNYSTKYNKYKLSLMLDDYYNYNVKSKELDTLYSTYPNIYNTYNNSFNGIDIDDYKDYIKKPLTISFSSLDNYNLCGFKYYINNVLKLDKYEETFPIFIGNLFHYILSLATNDNFNFDREWNQYIKEHDLSNKEQVLLEFIKKDFQKLLEEFQELMENTAFKDFKYEMKIEKKISKDIDIIFKGIVDKIMFYQNMNDTYYAVIDYKTYDKKINLNNLIYGMDMQLVIYTYLIGESNLFTNPVFAGMFYQKVLSTTRSSQEKDDIRLLGYTTDNIDILEKLDKNYTKSKLIKGLTYNESTGFGAYSKVLSDNELYNLNKLVKKITDEKIDNILNAEFSINPKNINKENVSCKFCKYKDLCFMSEKDIIYLQQQDLTDFLGGDINA